MNIRRPNLEFANLIEREETSAIVIHHSNGGADIDFSAAEIHQMHISKDYSGIGYHFVIRKDGTLEIGRPEYAIGAHAYGHNYYTLGICLSGDFQHNQPTQAQIQTCAELISELCADYQIPIDRHHIFGHRQLNDTDCPGDFLYDQIDFIIERAIALS